MKTISSDDILNRLKTALVASTDKELADMLGIKKATLSNWRARNSIDFSLVFSFCEHINLNWLVYGTGEVAASAPPVVRETHFPSTDPTMLEKIVAQAEEIGRLKERIAHLEQEKTFPAIHPPKSQFDYQQSTEDLI
ncbi:MAG: helix-turn-helix domain-containing protein [Muribaculaceae bacterium]|nr:helix-turn-helix domain-containing protein [Muribaculaceae bacterium]